MPTAALVVNGLGAISSIQVNEPGVNCVNPMDMSESISMSLPSSGTPAAAVGYLTTHIGTLVATAVSVPNGGSGYANNPTISLQFNGNISISATLSPATAAPALSSSKIVGSGMTTVTIPTKMLFGTYKLTVTAVNQGVTVTRTATITVN